MKSLPWGEYIFWNYKMCSKCWCENDITNLMQKLELLETVPALNRLGREGGEKTCPCQHNFFLQMNGGGGESRAHLFTRLLTFLSVAFAMASMIAIG